MLKRDIRSAVHNAATAERQPDLIQQITDAMEEDIVLGRLHPRERLIEDELIQRFQGKRHQIREALARLDTLGLIERVPNRGAIVRAFTAAEVEQLYALRIMLEAEGARNISLPLSNSALEQLRAVQIAHDAAVRDRDMRATFRSNLAFHRALFSNCENKFLTQAIEQYTREAHSVRFYSISNADLLSRARDEHWEMIRAIEQGNREELIRLCSDHLPPSKNAYLRLARLGLEDPASGPNQESRSEKNMAGG